MLCRLSVSQESSNDDLLVTGYRRRVPKKRDLCPEYWSHGGVANLASRTGEAPRNRT